VDDDNIDRIDAYLVGIAGIVAKASAEKNDEKFLRAVSVMGMFERMKIMVNKEPGQDPKVIDEIEVIGMEAAE